MAEEALYATTVKVVIVFAADHNDHGKKVDMPVLEAARLVREGRVVYDTDAQERKAEKALVAP